MKLTSILCTELWKRKIKGIITCIGAYNYRYDHITYFYAYNYSLQTWHITYFYNDYIYGIYINRYNRKWLTSWTKPCAFIKFPRLLWASTCQQGGKCEIITSINLKPNKVNNKPRTKQGLTKRGFKVKAWRQHWAASVSLPFLMYALAKFDHASQKLGRSCKWGGSIYKYSYIWK